MKIEFGAPVYLSAIRITDLFYENWYYEQGKYSLDGGTTWTLFSAIMGSPNGALTISLDNLLVSSLLFTAPEPFWKHDYSVAGLTAQVVPLPGAALLLGSGVLGLVLLRRRVLR